MEWPLCLHEDDYKYKLTVTMSIQILLEYSAQGNLQLDMCLVSFHSSSPPSVYLFTHSFPFVNVRCFKWHTYHTGFHLRRWRTVGYHHRSDRGRGTCDCCRSCTGTYLAAGSDTALWTENKFQLRLGITERFCGWKTQAGHHRMFLWVQDSDASGSPMERWPRSLVEIILYGHHNITIHRTM